VLAQVGQTADLHEMGKSKGVGDASTTIASSKKCPCGTEIWLREKIVTATWQDFFYIQEEDQSSGIRVEKTGHGLNAGIRVDITGTARVNTDGERYVAAKTVRQTGNGPEFSALGMPNRDLAVGWAWRWVHYPDKPPEYLWTTGTSSLTLGLMSKTWGRVTQVDPAGQYFYVWDGTDVKDGTQSGGEDNIGLRVMLYPSAPPLRGDYVIVSGVASGFIPEDGYWRSVLYMIEGGLQVICCGSIR
jgi:hypothetical protein